MWENPLNELSSYGPSNVPLTNNEPRSKIKAIKKHAKAVGKMMKKLLHEKHKKRKRQKRNKG